MLEARVHSATLCLTPVLTLLLPHERRVVPCNGTSDGESRWQEYGPASSCMCAVEGERFRSHDCCCYYCMSRSPAAAVAAAAAAAAAQRALSCPGSLGAARLRLRSVDVLLDFPENQENNFKTWILTATVKPLLSAKASSSASVESNGAGRECQSR